MRGDQLSRQWRILRQIEAGRTGLTAWEIAELFGVSLRTAYRDLDDLQLAGFPLYTEKGGEKGQRWRLIDTYKVNLPHPFTLTELLSLQLSRDLFKVFDGTVFQESLTSLFEKITAALPPESIAYLNQVRGAYHMGSSHCKNYGRYRELVSQVNKAVLEHRSIEIGYQGLNDKSPVRRKIDPYKIWFYDGTLYVVGLCHLRSKIRTFVLDRIKMLRVTGDSFEVPADFNFEDLIRHSFKVMQKELYTVVVQISPAWAQYVGERIWHESQSIQEQLDGGIEITMRVAGLEEIKQWIMGMGPEAYVLEPEELRGMIRKDLQATLAKYRAMPVLYNRLPEAGRF